MPEFFGYRLATIAVLAEHPQSSAGLGNLAVGKWLEND